MSDFGPTVSGFMNNISISKKPTADPWPYVPLDPRQGLILAFITLSGTSANVIGILVMIKVLQMRPVAPNVLVFGLALTDLYGIVVATLPTLLCYLEMKWYGGQMVCDLQGFSTIFVQSASGLLATIMALDRLLAVLKPFLYRRIVTAQKAFMTVCLIWVIGIVLALMPLVKLGRYKRNLTGTFCTIDWFADSIQNKIFALVFATVGITYVFVVVICNTIVAATLLKLRKERTKLTSEKGFQRHRVFPSKQDGSDRRKSTTTVDLELHFAKTVGIISFLFLICWLPFMVRIRHSFWCSQKSYR